MPIVTAPSRGQSNGEEVTEFLDTVSTTPTTYTFQTTQEKLKVKNNGYAAVQVTVNGATMTLFPTESKEFYGSIDSFIVVSSGGVQSFEVTGSNYKDEEIQLTGSNVNPDGSVKTSMSTSLSKDSDSIDVGRMSKGGLTPALASITATTTSGELNCSGYNSVFVEVIVTGTGTWTVALQGSLTSGGTFVDLYDGATAMSKQGIAASQIFLFKGIPDFLKVVATETADGATVSVRLLPLNV